MNEGAGASPEAICLKKPVQSQQYLIKINIVGFEQVSTRQVTMSNRLISYCEMFPTDFIKKGNGVHFTLKKSHVIILSFVTCLLH